MEGLSKKYFIFHLLYFINVAYGLNLGLLATDKTRLASPVVFNKITKHGPVVINIKPDLVRMLRTPPAIQTLSAPNYKLTEINSQILKAASRTLPRSADIPMLPHVPFFVSIMPGLNSILPMFPSGLKNTLSSSPLNRYALQNRRLKAKLRQLNGR